MRRSLALMASIGARLQPLSGTRLWQRSRACATPVAAKLERGLQTSPPEQKLNPLERLLEADLDTIMGVHISGVVRSVQAGVSRQRRRR